MMKPAIMMPSMTRMLKKTSAKFSQRSRNMSVKKGLHSKHHLIGIGL